MTNNFQKKTYHLEISTSQYLAYVICHVERSETSEVVLLKQMFHFVQHDNNNINYFQTCT
jgi:hypothetical protein